MKRIISKAQLAKYATAGADVQDIVPGPDPGLPMAKLEQTILSALHEVTAAIQAAASKPAAPPVAIRQQAPPAPRPTAWHFDVVRNKAGQIEAIRAKAVK